MRIIDWSSDVCSSDLDVVDPLTVRINTTAPFAPLLATLTDRSGMMVSPKAAKALGDKFATAPVCSGPFKFVERIAQDRNVLEKYDGYRSVERSVGHECDSTCSSRW